MSVRPARECPLPASGAPPPRRWPTIDARRANDSADEMIRSLVTDVQELRGRLFETEDSVKHLMQLRARDHLAREQLFKGRFPAMNGAFQDEEKSVYEVHVGLLTGPWQTWQSGTLADDERESPACTFLATVRFTEPRLSKGRVDYDGEIINAVAPFHEYAQDEYEIKCAARRYMLKHTGWQQMFPFGKDSHSVAPYALF